MTEAQSFIDDARQTLTELDSAQHEKFNLAIEQRMGELIKRRRLAAGMSRRQLAEYVGCKESYIFTLENGTDRFRAHQLSRILYALKITPASFFAEVFKHMTYLLGNPNSIYEVKK